MGAWRADPTLRLCSFAAKGLWMDLLAIAVDHDPIGYVAVNGHPLSIQDISRLTSRPVKEVSQVILELEKNGVFERNGDGVIYSRWLVGQDRRVRRSRENGSKGGNPSLRKHGINGTQVNPPGITPRLSSRGVIKKEEKKERPRLEPKPLSLSEPSDISSSHNPIPQTPRAEDFE